MNYFKVYYLFGTGLKIFFILVKIPLNKYFVLFYFYLGIDGYLLHKWDNYVFKWMKLNKFK